MIKLKDIFISQEKFNYFDFLNYYQNILNYIVYAIDYFISFIYITNQINQIEQNQFFNDYDYGKGYFYVKFQVNFNFKLQNFYLNYQKYNNDYFYNLCDYSLNIIITENYFNTLYFKFYFSFYYFYYIYIQFHLIIKLYFNDYESLLCFLNNFNFC